MVGAQILTQAMSESGTSVIFSLSGNQIMPIYDACLEPGVCSSGHSSNSSTIRPPIRIVHVRHESAAVFMADAYAQLSIAQQNAALVNRAKLGAAPGNASSALHAQAIRACSAFGVALVTAGPGFANALGGLYSALMAESPVVLVSGDSAVSQDGNRAFQELSQTTASRPFVKHAVRVTNVDHVADTWAECVAIATSGRPGPVHLAMPIDVLLAESFCGEACLGTKADTPIETISASTSATTTAKDNNTRRQSVQAALSEAEHTSLLSTDLASIVNALRKAKKPIVLTGPAMTGSRLQGRFAQLRSALGMPVIAMESPRGLADPSLGNIRAVIQQADCVLLLGKLPDFTLGFASIASLPANTILVVDASAESLQQSVAVIEERALSDADVNPDFNPSDATSDATPGDAQQSVIAINVNPDNVAAAICQNYQSITDHAAWLSYSVQAMAAVPKASDITDDFAFTDTDRQASSADHSVVLSPRQIGMLVQNAVDRCQQSIVVCDGGEFGQWAQACVRSDFRIINGPSGAIGGSLPQAVAAKIANPHSVVFAMLGDGTVGFHLAELETSIREKAPVIVIIGNDSRWNAEYQIQLRDYGIDRLHSCELGTDIRYDQAAVGLGSAGVMVQTEAELESALAEAVTRSLIDSQSTCINVSMAGWPAPVFG